MGPFRVSVIAVIPARGGSQRIPRKNIADCAGKPLIAWTAEAALECTAVDHAILSTDDPQIAEIGAEIGLEVPFLRPRSLAEDSTPMIPVLQHLLGWAKTTFGQVEAVVLLQPTSPLRTASHIEEAIKLFHDRKAQSVVSVCAVPHQFSPEKLLRYDSNMALDSFFPESALSEDIGAQKTAVGRNGPAILVAQSELIEQGSLYGTPNIAYVMHPSVSIDIDEQWQLDMASSILS
jgi:CMP-N,N'-diacetyllegionaminic acid synthase